ncbi:hypothetical protein G3I32_36215 [Streptomyces coelicoflavus]|uniref:Phage tail tape measure protein n=1 Tax=Streptomyces coelicoflavus TaxID=285562 RepID=A0A7K3PW41_9ACTN|nr:hypothetical protein [Streptomyces coelicoflavus]NEB14212.1 hypothetical protein [Streptomyces coelicoflavus]
MAERLTFTLTGRDELSRVLNGTGDSADRLRLRLSGITQDADGNLRDFEGRLLTVDEAQRRLLSTTEGTRDAFGRLRDETDKVGESLRANLISLLPAAIPAAAGLAGSAAAVAAQFGAVAVAAGAYALALGPQIGAIGEAADAQAKYEDALRTSGAGSAEAGAVALEYERQMAALPPATREAAVAVGLLKDAYQEWSDSLSGDVMGPFIKGVGVTNVLLPKTTGLVKGASSQFDRLITMVAGGIASPGFDALNDRFTTFANDTMRHAVDELALFFAKLDAGEFDGGGVAEFFDWAQEQGPVVWDTLQNVGDALLNVLEAGADVGVGMLDVVNVLSDIVSAVPPDAIATILQLAIAIKAVRLAAAGGAAASAGIAAIATQVGAMRVAASGAPGVLAGTAAAIGTLSRTAKLAVAGTGIGLLVLALGELSQAGEPAALDVDKLTTSLGELGRTGKATGYVADQFGDDFAKLREQIQKVIDPSVAESINNWGADVTGGLLDAGDATEEFTKSVDGIDQGLADLVSGGKAEQAAAALEAMKEGMSPEQVEEFTGSLDNYKDALAAQAFEQRLAADSMGIFGDQALEVQAQLDAQKQSADGLRQSIMALNDTNRSAYDAQIGFEASIDALTESFKENGATLDLNTEAGRENGEAMSAAAKAHDEMIASGLAAGESMGSMTEKSEGLRAKMLELAGQTGMTDQEAREYVNTLLGTPESIATVVELERQDAITGLLNVQAEIEKTPGAKSVTVTTLNAAAIKALEDVGLKTRRLPDGRTEVFTANGQALGAVGAVDKALNNVDGRRADATVTVTYRSVFEQVGHAPSVTADALRRQAEMFQAQGGPIHRAQGGGIPHYDGGGRLYGPGTPTSDSVLIAGSVGEYMIRAAAVDYYGEQLFDALNAKTLQLEAPLPGRPAPSPGRAAAAASSSASQPAVTNNYTYNVRKSVIDAKDVRLIMQQEEARQRVGRPR